MTPVTPTLAARLSAILARADAALKGEPARFIGYGAAIVIVGVVAVANALGITRFGANIDLADALILAGLATSTIIGVIETIRRFVSPISG